MPKNVQVLMRLFVSLAFLVVIVGCNAAAAQTEVSGEWTGSLDQPNIHKEKRRTEKPDSNIDEQEVEDSVSDVTDTAKGDRLYLNFERRSSSNSHNMLGHTFAFSELQGLTREQVERGGPVKFSLAREAGTISCEGSFQNRKGSGTFRFTANASFISAMKSRGFDFEKTNSRWGHGDEPEDKLFSAAALNVTTALADDLLSVGLGKLDVDDLFKAAIFKIDSKFASEMKASGFPNLDMEDLVKARIFKIDAAFVTQVMQMGFARESFEDLVKMRIFKVTPEFIAMARGEGLTNLSVEELVKMRIFKIDSDFIRKAHAEGVPLDVERLVERRIGARHREE
ncbi:MAG TPA: hypothetical protein VJT50_01410 [Pyrinomonadaceae bacterium]|nr:hypothetical protein [Pyrinomonadaceae bacterium]